ncbi:hypothetical protein BATDEDRAFT_9008 [Batrachochytrium dendrobatidis JAM81]|uniref:Ribosomal RNA-processing protein 43 n=2 Tax=Batrachochytrium dendrobatidis TaxID=109871 RepID=F4NTM1_BATDJ|nr:uncharacterized protein BATDEDRAFT_9008 [Batrachochytrium dendrobatidis JAM81]EGF83526.1 hypothetical protein BATDEDRAFT_9008 [Batrachochytrium dendrobatidis JAM81]OAJ37262.1 hypothetical protein BDEG_21307 [Batrachochytrium dendrobatidis JEL423]|eukprot:XP_006675068.1 hypothetical protein BATDEDRAFT_9008 [Batrachochytrium dendrobatidis JAM81]
MVPQESDHSKDSGFVLDPDTFKKIQPLEYHRRFIQEGVRADGRPLLHFRNTELDFGPITSASGSVSVKVGDTSVICAIKAELAEPAPTLPYQGYLVPNVDLPALCASHFRPGPPCELAQSISTFLNNIISSGNVLDLESLCVVPGKVVWVLYADIVCLNYAGNIFDASVDALIAALCNVKLPEVTISDESAPVINNLPAKPLKLNRILISSTFAIFDGQTLLADPTHEEEPLVSSTVTIVVDDKDCICAIHKPGGVSITKAVIDECLTLAKSRTPSFMKLISNTV